MRCGISLLGTVSARTTSLERGIQALGGPLINTLLQQGDRTANKRFNRSNGFSLFASAHGNR